MNQAQADDEDATPLPGAGFISIFAGGPAQKAGLRQEDRVLRFEGKEVRGMAELRAALAATAPGQKVSVRVLREGREVELKVVMGTMPPEPELQRLQQQSSGDPAKARRVRFRSVPARPAGTAAPDRVALTDGNSLEGRVKALSAAGLVLALESGVKLTLDPGQVASARFKFPEQKPPAFSPRFALAAHAARRASSRTLFFRLCPARFYCGLEIPNPKS